MSKFIKFIVPVIIIIAGAAVMMVLIRSREEPKKELTKDPGILVKTIEAVQKDTTIIVKSTGTVQSSREVSVIPQVSGRVIYVSPELAVGGLFRQDDLLFKIEEIDYVLALEQANAARANAEFELAKIESSASIARSEWERMNPGNETEPNPLVLYKPQLANAKAALASANAAVDQAMLALERTEVTAPFNARVKSENVDVGQYITSGSSVSVLSGTDTVEINVPLSAEDLHWLNIPLHGSEPDGPDAAVSVNIGGIRHEWHGHILRSTGEVDPTSRMMNIIIEVSDPYGLKGKNKAGRPALAIGTFVDVEIKGKKLKNVFEIPRSAFRDNSTVWVMDNDNTLRIRNVVVLKKERETVIVSKGLSHGERLVATSISGAADGMKLRQLK